MTEASGPGREAALVGLLQAPDMEPALAQLLRPLRLRLQEWQHLRTHHRPRAGASAVYRLRARARDGQLLTLHAVASTAAAAKAPQTTMARVAGTQLRLWLHPRDPQLPDLPWASSATAVGRDLFDGALPALETLAYRPLRRAVIRAAEGDRVRYLKVLPPRAATALRARHVLLQDAGLPVPALVPGAPAATVAAEQLSGSPLVRPLITGSSANLDPLQLPALLDRLPAEALTLRARPAWSERVLEYAHAASVALPGAHARIRALAEAAAEAAAGSDAGPVVPVHGDFHPANLLVRQGQVTGLLDLDAVGPGHRVDDLACFLGHAAVLAAVNPHRPEAAAETARFRSAFETVVDPTALAARAAAVALTLVAGARGRPFRPRAHEAELRLAAAEALLHRRLPGEP